MIRLHRPQTPSRGLATGLAVLLLSLAAANARAHGPAPGPGANPPAAAAPPAAHEGKPAAPTEAPPPSPPANPERSAAQVAEARNHFRRGVTLFEDHDYNGALAEFETAYKLSREPVALYNVGLTLRALFRYVDAIEALSRYLNNTAMDDHVPARKRAEIEASISEMRALLAEVVIALPRGAKDALMSIDGRQTAAPPGTPILLSAGHHVVEISAPGYEGARKELDVVAGQNQHIDVAMTEIPRKGTANIYSSVPGTKIRIDGQPSGIVPVSVNLSPGGHQLEAEAAGYQIHRSELVVAAGQSRQVYLTLEIPPPPPSETGGLYRKWWFWTAVGAVAVAGGTAAVVASQGSAGISHVNGSLGSSKVP
jgi:hypothetical protein